MENDYYRKETERQDKEWRDTVKGGCFGVFAGILAWIGIFCVIKWLLK